MSEQTTEEPEFLETNPSSNQEDEYETYDDYGEYEEGGESPLNRHNDLLKELTNFDPYLREAFNNWLGIVWSEKKGKYLKSSLLRPLMNISGASWCSGVLKTYARSNNIITDIGQDDYNDLMEDVIEYIWLNLSTRMEEFGIKQDGDILRICNEIEHAIKLVLLGAGDGKYNKLLQTTVSRHESVNSGMNDHMNYGSQTQVPKRTGIIGKIKNTILGDA